MKTKLFLAAAVAAISLGAAGAQAAPASIATDVATTDTGSAIDQAKHKFGFYFGYSPYYYYKPYYYYTPYCPYWKWKYGYCY